MPLLPPPRRYVQIVERDDQGHLPLLLCPYEHVVRKRVQCWGEWGFQCDGRRRAGSTTVPCGARLWLISLPGGVYVLLEVSEHEIQTMGEQRMRRWQQLQYLTGDARRVAA